jgi:hypothetical protein
MVAAARGESLSWVLEQVIYSHFAIAPPRYVGRREADLDLTAPRLLKFPKSA